MHKFISQLRQILIIFVVGLTFLASATLGQFGYQLQAQAAPLTPEAHSYQVNQGANQNKAEDTEGGLVESLKDAADTVREKLNLDEPLPESTKAFFKQVQGEDVQVKEEIPSGKGEVTQN